MRFFLFLGLFLPISGYALLPLPGPEPEKFGIGLLDLRGTEEYRLGDEWGKKPVTLDSLRAETPAFQRAALATAKVSGATGFYLGVFNGVHVMATNHHVYPSSWSCRGRVTFPLLDVTAQCEKFLGTWPEIDLSLFTIQFSKPADAEKLAPVGANFRFHQDVVAGEELITIGFGVAGNNRGQLMGNQDSDCYVFSGEGAHRLMADPDRLNPGSYKAWSFALGCDVSHGDSGSAIVDRASSDVVGIIWTGRIPKSREAGSSDFLTGLFRRQDDKVWDELSYAVPAVKIKEVVTAALPGLKQDVREILQAVLQ